MKRSKTPLRGSVTQSVSKRPRDQQDGISFLARLGMLAIALLIVVMGAYASWLYGWPQRKAEKAVEAFFDMTRSLHFEIRDIALEGRVHSSKEEVYDALRVKQGLAIMAVDIDAAAERLGKLPWVDSVAVERKLPDTIYVLLFERVPSARWQNNGRFFVIDNFGRVLPTAEAEKFPDLPQVVGPGADQGAKGLLSALNAYPDIRGKMTSAVRVSDRRWDLHMAKDIIVKLPETEVEGALRRLSVLIAEEKILDRPLVAIDLRIPDRLVLEPPQAQDQSGDKRS
ncbi:MAG: cell division protein FtsQ/DivIB [Alphaproteobacteria bacterium]|nr:cell division protein FtsQ/DivIB [Alphaproteobacteria bacterium]